jgi:cysteine desulfurase
MIYLDHNATTPLDERVKKSMSDALAIFGNPSSSHAFGLAAREVIENARFQTARLIGCRPDEIIFTSGGTEANNLAIIGTAYKRGKGHIIVSSVEHPSVMNPVRWLAKRGFDVTLIPVDSGCIIDSDDVKRALKHDTILITVMHSNNETGSLQPITEVGKIAKEYGIAFHTDAAQSIGKMPVYADNLLTDMITIVPHKFYGPKGVGALYIKGLGGDARHAPHPVLLGAGHERGIRPGTENTVGIAGFGAACEAAAGEVNWRAEHAAKLRDLLFDMLKDKVDISLNGHKSLRLPNTLNISIKGVNGHDIVEGLKDSVAFSAGSACHSGVCTPSAVLKMMGLSDEKARSSVRLSVGKDNTTEEIEAAAEMIFDYVKKR